MRPADCTRQSVCFRLQHIKGASNRHEADGVQWRTLVGSGAGWTTELKSASLAKQTDSAASIWQRRRHRKGRWQRTEKETVTEQATGWGVMTHWLLVVGESFAKYEAKRRRIMLIEMRKTEGDWASILASEPNWPFIIGDITTEAKAQKRLLMGKRKREWLRRRNIGLAFSFSWRWKLRKIKDFKTEAEVDFFCWTR